MTSLVGLLMVLLILGVLGAIAVGSLGPTSAPTAVSTSSISGGPPSVAPSEAAIRALCLADYQSLSTALQVYDTLHGTPPPAGTSWVAGIESGSSWLAAWPSDPGHFTFVWDGQHLGVVPHHGRPSSSSAGSSSPGSGCWATLS